MRSRSVLFVLTFAASAAAARQTEPGAPPPAQAASAEAAPGIGIPRLFATPKLDDLLEMAPTGPAGTMAKVEGFLQSTPRDGAPVSQRTEAYLGYDDHDLYIAWICFDAEPSKIRARRTPREQAFSDDFVEVTLDTFHDRRRAYVFWSNPLGVQAEGLWDEDSTDPQWSWDATWETRAKRTAQGYVVLMAIPFKSLRFPTGNSGTWGIVLLRQIPRSDEYSYWPRVSSTVRGRLSQEGTISGFADISPGRNIQITPYGFASDDWTIDESALPDRKLERKPVDATAGVDGKFVFGDKVVLDATVNPDFSQVESDTPQIAVNQRFELYYPEKRPFFLENSDLFGLVSFPMLFTRRIADPSVGARVTGKAGRTAFGAIVADDESPGKIAPLGDPLHGSRAWFGVASVREDILKQSSIRFLATDREYQDGYNRVAGIEGNFKLGKNWLFNAAAFQSATRATSADGGSELHGPAFELFVQRNGRKFNTYFEYVDIAKDFRTQAGFVPRVDVRQANGYAAWLWRPEGKIFISHGPTFTGNLAYDQGGTRLDWVVRPSWVFNLLSATYFEVFYRAGRERLRPEDLAGLADPALLPVDLPVDRMGIFFGTDYWKKCSVYGDWRWGHATNYFPPSADPAFLTGPPERAIEHLGSLEVVLRPVTPLAIDLSALYSQLNQVGTDALIFRDLIGRMKATWQFDLHWSLRLILQYDDLKSDPSLVAFSVPLSRKLNTDILVTWLAHPGTALYLGYNTNSSNLSQFEADVPGVTRTGLVNDSRRAFVKFSYQFRL